jgi:hypothetical protein
VSTAACAASSWSISASSTRDDAAFTCSAAMRGWRFMTACTWCTEISPLLTRTATWESATGASAPQAASSSAHAAASATRCGRVKRLNFEGLTGCIADSALRGM